MIEHKYVGFISQKVNYKDSDAIVNVITKNGKKTFKAKGILKVTSKNATSCNYFMLSEFITYSKAENSNETLKTSQIVKLFKKPYDDLLVSSSYLYMVGLLDKLSDQVNGYELTLKCFNYLEEGIYPINVLNYFLKNLTSALGYDTNLNGCINCNAKDNLVSFDFEDGGFICNKCFNESRYEKLPSLFLKSIYEFMKNDEFKELNDNQAIRLFKMYNKFLNDVVGIYTNEYDFILKSI